MSDEIETTELSNLAKLESLLLVASGPTPVNRLGQALELTPSKTRKLVDKLEKEYENRGFQLQHTQKGVQITTNAGSAEIVEKFLGLQTMTRLSRAVLEVLAIIAYQQPVTRPRVDHIRGVNSDGSLRKLLSFNLIEEVGREEGPGRPILYGTTPEFLQQLGLSSLVDLPELPDLDTIELQPSAPIQITEPTAETELPDGG